ncbi:hypothetical protein SAMN02745111_00708 [Eubacterium uniforme]|uniref:Uncharacterized protein n=1 Tax=Eubacterium uniforme TaxID=39495 RepID=A0A1T4VCY4_9FIRM|nr:hypothetical protein [Eubacterium uniforme]SKA62824.1 hypothetical protein SAMN02745111_00708 [Eubacterium uniforme]
MSEKKIEELAKDFLICCYFGQSVDLGKAAVDRAYVDMAAHTLKFNGECLEKWRCRYETSNMILDRIEKYNKEEDFEEWHKKLIADIIIKYKIKIDGVERVCETLSEGQAQKWLNMTIKYLVVLKCLLSDDERKRKGFDKYEKFFNYTEINNYRMPIDSYIIKKLVKDNLIEAKYKNEPWSKLNTNQYEKYKKINDIENEFLWELENWESAMNMFKRYNADSYEHYKREYVKRG